jgi:23S rRNA (cytosine1962-C5)-methyltransferase
VPQEGWPLSWNDEVSFTAKLHPVPPSGFLSRYGPRLALDARAGGLETAFPQPLPKPTLHEPVRLYRRRHLGAVSAGAQMVHVDASKKSVAQARENAALSGMSDRPIRWIVDDAAKFVAREVRRERRYDGILLDPPKYGRGPDGEVWRLEEDLPGLIANCRQLLDANSRFLFLTVYAVRMSAYRIGQPAAGAFCRPARQG